MELKDEMAMIEKVFDERAKVRRGWAIFSVVFALFWYFIGVLQGMHL